MPRSADLQHSRGVAGLGSAAPLAAFGIVVVNMLPLFAVVTGRMSMGDVFVVYWIENVAVWLITIVKVATAGGEPGPDGRGSVTINGRPLVSSTQPFLAGFFAFHYGLFTLVHGVFAFVMAAMADGELNPGYWLLAGAGLALGHLASLWINWYEQEERWQVTAGFVMTQPYPRMIVLHVAIIASFFLVLRGQQPGDSGGGVLVEIGPVVILCLLKTCVDLGFYRRERRRAKADAAGLDPRHSRVAE